jgi:hypothetical protein
MVNISNLKYHGMSHGIKIGAVSTKCGVSMEKKREDLVH